MSGETLSCSVVIPCHNEAENIEECVKRVPQMGKWTEIVVVDDGSTDGTSSIVEKLMAENENLRLISYSENKGKGFAVKNGFDEARGDVVMILDADMAVEPEVLPHFFEPIARGEADAVNGTRMLLPMERGAMSRFHYFGNVIFSLIFSHLLGQRITDTLCGTKALRRKDYKKIRMGRCPWGD
ncbi:MAG TPA: glycosyltransferase family 2 protein, partial [Candidatus Omnitrophica bacterium]|nr:glycosyltransferase family 2 protein [Candidatus Omnitrophota bacterium]